MQIKKSFSMNSRTGRDLQRYNRGCRQVVGCIPYRCKTRDPSSCVQGSPIDDLEFLLISSQKNPRMMFPKGGWEIDESLEEAASRETFEEAGVVGEVVVQEYLGTWSFKSKSQGTFHEGHMFPLRVLEELDEWPEKTVRRRLWVNFSEAREVCWHPWMKEALDVFASKVSKRKEGTQIYHFKELSDESSVVCCS
ncbi:Nudix hydrolase 17, mitochondrial [Capsicum chinense]|nr:Nudix hydrolase 17, mitochondrial [Capsicum chinense]